MAGYSGAMAGNAGAIHTPLYAAAPMGAAQTVFAAVARAPTAAGLSDEIAGHVDRGARPG